MIISNDIMRNSDVFMRFSSSVEELIEAKIPEAEETINNESKNYILQLINSSNKYNIRN